MEIRQAKLRMQFKAETDLDINGETISSYVNWLEKLSIEEINKDILSENENLKNVIQNAMDILDDGISSR
ncbi:MAG: hypothetical protein B6226_06180 [Candidatus Cloacimonetes bacterium 4572_65]|nr:MAG: hypothetical protein B6226_06180 [Candidatus Cloacimonetes bacterium 4572_65]